MSFVLGVKAAGRSALAGGVILAAIEGFNLLLMRVLMPSMEQQAQQAGMPVDKLLPPRDPTRVTYSARATTQGKSLWESSSGSPSPFYTTDSTTNSPASSGFDLGSLIKESEASAQKDSWNSNSTNSNLSQSSEDKESKPFWKLW